ncbi:hypothetical protein OIE66_11560 [Nonomuraea sp. NBC_01738]|nr:hypothetical protein OIE66_11560 [Nonomuraea sp. NBC_01738]
MRAAQDRGQPRRRRPPDGLALLRVRDGRVAARGGQGYRGGQG